jgi:hypothetical protein
MPHQNHRPMTTQQRLAVGKKIQKVMHEEKAKPENKRRPRKQVYAMAYKMTREEDGE